MIFGNFVSIYGRQGLDGKVTGHHHQLHNVSSVVLGTENSINDSRRNPWWIGDPETTIMVAFPQRLASRTDPSWNHYGCRVLSMHEGLKGIHTPPAVV